MAWHVYEIPPVDFGWRFLKTVAETAADLGASDGGQAVSGASHEGPSVGEFASNWKAAQEAARDKGWDGDFRQPAVVFWIPGDTEFTYGFVFKQDNNGTTYVVSPVALPSVAQLE
jgi:hypothetical protein